MSPGLQHDATIALLVAAIGIPLTTVTTGLRGILEAYEDFRIVNLLRIGLGTANFALPALSVLLVGNSIAWMIAGLICARLIVMMAHVWQVHKRLPGDWLTARFNRKDMRQLLSFGAWMVVSNIVSPLMVSADRFVISGVLGATVVAFYTVPSEALVRILVVPGALTAALFPRLAANFINAPREAVVLYKRCLKLVTIFLLPICLIVAAGSWWGLRIWLGEEFADHSWLIVCILSLGIFLNGIAFVPFAAVQATGDARTTAYLHTIELVLYVPSLLLSLHLFGLIGAAAVWTARTALDLFALLVVTKKEYSSYCFGGNQTILEEALIVIMWVLRNSNVNAALLLGFFRRLHNCCM
ncbi:oligosaccharide flippase family protein [Ralstonia sp. L16]|uniref:oligosaccharide flippase family protein n=1 Tax=Ralstonia sp. L16 TaxID=3423950 RepID=UPI003F7AB2BE